MLALLGVDACQKGLSRKDYFLSGASGAAWIVSERRKVFPQLLSTELRMTFPCFPSAEGKMTVSDVCTEATRCRTRKCRLCAALVHRTLFLVYERSNGKTILLVVLIVASVQRFFHVA